MEKGRLVELVAEADKLAKPNRIAALAEIEKAVGTQAYRWARSRYEAARWFAAEGIYRSRREEFPLGR